MRVFVETGDFTLYHGDALETLRELPAESVDCCVSSPPYWGLRDYDTAGQIGLEQSPDAYVAALVDVFEQVRRVLVPSGTCWVNLGDGYNANTGTGFDTNGDGDINRKKAAGAVGKRRPWGRPKDLVGIPWRVAFALQQAGWYLRSEVIWAKPNPMPESSRDRPTRAHETVFLLTKRARYYYDQEAVRERFVGAELELAQQTEPLDGLPGEAPRGPDGRRKTTVLGMTGSAQHRDGERWPNGGGRNMRSVWTIVAQPYPEAHFATYPEELVRRCVLAGCPEWVCATCGKPRERIVEKGESDYSRLKGERSWRDIHDAQAHRGGADDNRYNHTVTERGTTPSLQAASSVTTGWSDCGHDDYRPAVVLDPFIGSGTTALVARKFGRRAIGIELNATYCELAARRNAQQTLWADA